MTVCFPTFKAPSKKGSQGKQTLSFYCRPLSRRMERNSLTQLAPLKENPFTLITYSPLRVEMLNLHCKTCYSQPSLY